MHVMLLIINRYAFNVITPGASLIFTVDCMRELVEWITIIQRVRRLKCKLIKPY